MTRQMPDMIDLLVVTIEAGLGILASMRVAAESLPDPLGQELRLTLQEQRMGLSVNEAIESLGRRADCSNMRIFVRSLTQGERLGVSIGDDDAEPRARDAEAAEGMVEETAQKIPIKMLFPLGVPDLPGDVHRPARPGLHQDLRSALGGPWRR